MGIYLICFGESEKNLSIALKEKVIGINQAAQFDEKASAYLIVKRQNNWTVVAKANIKKRVEMNPFPKPNKYRVYEIINVVECNPYSISDLLKSELGNMYGLALRTPNLITAQELIIGVENRFTLS